MQISEQGRRFWPPTSVDWIFTHHDAGGHAETTSLRRVRALIWRVHEVWLAGPLSEIGRVTGQVDPVDPEPEEDAGTGVGQVVFMGTYEPVLQETPRAEGWLLEREILEDLGPHTW